MLEVRKLSKTYVSGSFQKQEIRALDNVSFRLEKGKTLGIMGKSGCGKTTLSRIIAGLLLPDCGEIFLNEQNILELKGRNKKEICKKIQIIFQNPTSALDPSKKIRSSLREPMIVQNLKLSKAEQMNKIEHALEITGLSGQLLDRYPHEVSGGEAQRLVICRSLLLDPEILILDEPTSMLDVSIQASVMTLLKKLQERYDLSYLLISHDLDILTWSCDQIAVMNAGKIIEYGLTEEIIHTPQTAYTKELIQAFF